MKAAAIVVALLGGAAIANAGLVDVAFYSSNFAHTTMSGAAVLGAAGDVWNSFDAGNPNTPTNYGPFALVDTASNATGISLSFNADGGVISGHSGTQPDPNLTNSYLYNNTSGPITETLTGLAPNASYNLVLYVASDDALRGDRSVTGSANTSAFAATGNPQSTFINGENVVELTVSADSTGALAIAENDGLTNTSGEVDLNGLQLQSLATPEPGSLLLLCLGAGALLVRKRRA